MNIGKAIRDLRKEKGMSQDELSRLTGITQAALSQIEMKDKRPSKENLAKIGKALKVPVSLIYALGLEPSDVPEDRKEKYEELFPIIKNLIIKIGG